MTKRLTETYTRVCGNEVCQCKKTDSNTWSFGLGDVDYRHGYHSDPCWACARWFKANHSRAVVHPTGPVERRNFRRFVINRKGHAPSCGHTQPHLEVRNMSQRLHDFLVGMVTCNLMPDPRYKLSHAVSAFLQGHNDTEWILVEFWTDNEDALQAWEDYVNARYPLEEIP